MHMANTSLCMLVFISFNTFVWTIQDLHNLKTKWMTHLGCFSVKEFTNMTKVQLTYTANNQPKTCAIQCEKWSFFAVLDLECYCFDEDTFRNLMKGWSNRCHRKCPDYTDSMYCGSNDRNYVNVNKYEQGLSDDLKDNDIDCLAATTDEKRIHLKQMSCEQAVSFICSGHFNTHAGEKLPFKKAKHYCENLQSKLMNLNESLPQKMKDDVFNWVGTFRQFIYSRDKCEPGPMSSNEEPCKPCSPGTYGTQCDNTCNCKIMERCDTISGCILKNVSSEMSGPSKPDIFLYTAGSAILLLLVISIVLLLVCIRKYKSQANQIIRQNVHPNIDENEVATCNNERFYESIDESAIYKSMHISNPAENLHDKKQSRSENSSTKSENYGYLDSCSTYTEIKEPQMHCTRLNSYNSRGESSSSEYFETGSGYIHPYQQLQQEQGQLKSAPAYVYTELICEFESSAFVPSLTHFHIAGRYSLPELHSTDQTQYNSLTNDNTNQPVKYSSI